MVKGDEGRRVNNLKYINMDNKEQKEGTKENIEILLRKDGIIEFRAVGNLNERFIKEMEKRVVEELEIVKKLPGNVKILADMEGLDIDPRTGWRSTVGLRKLAVEFLTWEKLEKAAILTNKKSALLRVAVLFIFKLVGSKKAKYFFDKEEAEKWLK